MDFLTRPCFALVLTALLVACGTAAPLPPPSLERAAALARDGMLKQAEKEVGRVLAQDQPGQHAAAMTRRGCIRVERGDAQGALGDLRALPDLGIEGRACLGKAYALVAAHEQTFVVLAPIVDGGDFSAETALLAVQAAFALRHVQDALRLVRGAVEKYPRDARLQVLLSKALVLKGDLTHALDTLSEAEAIDPDSPEVPFVKGNILWALERYDDAVKAYRRSLELNPHFAQAAANLGMALAQSGKNEEAVEALRKAQQADPTDITMMNNLAAALAEMGNLEEAAALFDKALEAVGEDQHLLESAATLRARLGEGKVAIDLLERAAAAQPTEPEVEQKTLELAAFRLLYYNLCSELSPIRHATAKLKEQGWKKEEIIRVLDRVLNEPIFDTLLEAKEKQCRK